MNMILWLTFIQSALSTSYETIKGFISKLQNPSPCSAYPHYSIEMNLTGGFASQFQMMVYIWLKVQSSTHYKFPVVMRGPIRGYTETGECKALAFVN